MSNISFEQFFFPATAGKAHADFFLREFLKIAYDRSFKESAMQGVFFQIASVLLLVGGYLFGIFLCVPRTVRAYAEWRNTMLEKHFGYFVNDLGLTLFVFLAPSVVFIKKICVFFG